MRVFRPEGFFRKGLHPEMVCPDGAMSRGVISDGVMSEGFTSKGVLYRGDYDLLPHNVHSIFCYAHTVTE